MKDINDHRLTFLSKLEALPAGTPTATFSPSPEYWGPGWQMYLRRLRQYRWDYVLYVAGQLVERAMAYVPDIPTRTETFWGRELLLPKRDSNAQMLRTRGALSKDEDGLTRFFIRNLNEDSVFYDIGANYGFYTALAQEFVTVGEVHAFEPNARIFRYLSQLKDAKTFFNQIALSDKAGIIEFFDCSPGNSSGKSTIIQSVVEKHRWRYRTTKIQATTLDEYCKEHRSPTIVKIDVEGAERQVLKGGEGTLRRYAPTIAIELWSGDELSSLSRDVLRALETLGYTPNRVLQSGETEAVTYEKLELWLQTRQDETNFVFNKKI